MPEQPRPIATELALADALDRLVVLIEELRTDADLRVEITTDETDLVKLAFSGTPAVGYPLRRRSTGYSRRGRPTHLERGTAQLRGRVI